MKVSRGILVISIIFFLAVGIVSAADLNGTDTVSSQPNQCSFNELQDLVDRAPEKTTINLTMDYLSDNDDFPNGINIAKPLTINGNNHTIDANHNSRIFNVFSSGVELNNIIFINGKADREGGAVRFDNGGTINNCTFKNNYAKTDGGAVYMQNGEIYDSTFINNSVAQGEITDSDGTILGYGGAVYQEKSTIYNSTFIGNEAFDGGGVEQRYDSNVYGSTFINNYAVDGGGVKQYWRCSIYNSDFINNTGSSGAAVDQDKYCNVYDSNFINNRGSYGSAVYQFESNVYRSNFENNHAEYYGGAVYQEESTIYNSTFIGNSAKWDGGAVNQYGSNVYNSYFENNSAKHGGAVYQEYYSYVYNSTFNNNQAKFGCNDICDPSFHSKPPQEALNNEHRRDTYKNKAPTFKGMLKKGSHNPGGMFQEGANNGTSPDDEKNSTLAAGENKNGTTPIDQINKTPIDNPSLNRSEIALKNKNNTGNPLGLLIFVLAILRIRRKN